MKFGLKLVAVLLAFLLCSSLAEAGRRGCGGGGCGACRTGCFAPPPVVWYAPSPVVFYQPMPVGPVARPPVAVYQAPTAPVFLGCFGGCCGGQCCR